MSEASARILRILLNCGMIAREEQEIVRALIGTPAREGPRPLPAAFPGPSARSAAQPRLR
jgi:hypothetical protein